MTKKFLLGLSVLPIAISPVVFVAQSPAPANPSDPNGNSEQGQASGDANSSDSNTPANLNNKKAEEPITEEDLKNNQKWWDDNRAQLIGNFVDQVKKDIDNKLGVIFSKTRNNLEDRLSQSFFWLQLKHYFDANKEQIEQDPIAFGLNFLTPYIYSNNINLKQGDVKFGKDDFNGIEWGTADKSDYSQLPNVKVDNVKDTKNTLKGKDFEKRIKGYFAQLSSGYQNYLFKEDEFPQYKKNFKLKLNTTGKEQNTILESEPLNKPGISSWSDWIQSYFEKQSLLLDLSLNQLPNPSSSQSPQVQIDSALKDIDLNVPPQIGQKPEFEIRIAPDLSPILHWDLIKKTPQDVQKIFNSATKEQKATMFFFLNPIHSRFKYEVKSLNITNNKLEAQVQIIDNVQKAKQSSTPEKYQKSYTIPVYNDFEPTDTQETKIILTKNLYTSNLGVSKVVDDFFDTLNIKGDFKFSDIKNYSQLSQNLIYNFFYLLTKVFYNNQFLSAQKKLVRSYINGSSSRLFVASQSQFIDFFQKSIIDSNKALDYYYLIYYTHLLNIYNLLNSSNIDKKGDKDKIKQVETTLQKLSISKSDVDKIFNKAREQNLLLRQTIHKINPNLIAHYSDVINYGRKLNKASQLLGQIAFYSKNIQDANNNSNPSTDSKSAKNQVAVDFASSLEKYNQEQNQSYNTNLIIYISVAIIVAVLLAVVVTQRSFILKRSKK